ncbi:ribosome recycling factor [Geovibrio ferrireducens]|jgi:ribosome recycling factor|uniref:ribosome recycling factor n=1 Tax=Geovibrio ferrireducens TaxID=46201 RepID=UPI0022464479|nr:ribosome recycling factor [Geovibrio ferrireducens]
MLNKALNEASSKMEKALNHLKDEFKAVRTGRASVSVFDNVKVDYYGTPTPLSGVATLSAPEPRLILIQPWDASLIPAIEKAIMASNLGYNPQNDGKVVRIPIPQLTEERRKEFVKLVKKMGEDTKVAVRNIRRDANDELKKLEKDKAISEDDCKKGQDKVQEITNDFVKKIDAALDHKEKEIMEI